MQLMCYFGGRLFLLTNLDLILASRKFLMEAWGLLLEFICISAFIIMLEACVLVLQIVARIKTSKLKELINLTHIHSRS